MLPDLPLRSPCSLLLRDLDPNPGLDLDLNLVVDNPKAAVPLDLFLLLLRQDLDLDPELVLTSQEDPLFPRHHRRLRRCCHHRCHQ